MKAKNWFILVGGFFTHAQACLKFSEITDCQFICEKLDNFLYYGHTVGHRWILQINLSLLLGVIMHVQALPKCCETTNHQCLGKS